MPHQSGIAKRFVVWSGGADSTLVLADALREAADGIAPIPTAVTLRHGQVNSVRDRAAEQQARQLFIAWARKKFDLAFPHAVVDITMNDHASARGRIGQKGIFLCHVFPYVSDSDPGLTTVEFGYIKTDDFWHDRGSYVAAFDALVKLTEAKTSIQFPLEWVTKEDVLRRLKTYGVPRAAWWTCDRTLGTTEKPIACGTCLKCVAVGQKKAPAVYLRAQLKTMARR